MQSVSRQPHSDVVQPQTRGIAVMAIILFALAGLLSGFAVGAFVRPGQHSQVNLPSQPGTTPSTQKTHAPTAPVTDHPTTINEPTISAYTYNEVANGSTLYTFTASTTKKNGASIAGSDLTCKIWLTKDGNVNASITANRLRSVSTLSQPFPREVLGGLMFSTSTPQTQTCANGQGMWSYTLSQTVQPGLYYVVALMDWEGVHYNWSWVAIRVKPS
jgi:hypothetical protein